jgi:NADH-quinone oxidoreductase subunit L
MLSGVLIKVSGIYAMFRIFYGVFDLIHMPQLQSVILWLGIISIFVGALAALGQTDIKRMLAYSSISQIGYMFLAVGVGAWSAAIFHFMTHAYFKALLFLCAGSIIHAMHERQDIQEMGGLRRRIPLTHWTFLMGLLAICGTPSSQVSSRKTRSSGGPSPRGRPTAPGSPRQRGPWR